MAKGQFSKAQNAWLAEQLPEYIKQLDAGVRGGGLTKWKQSIATKALDSPEFADLDFTAHPRTKWFGVRPPLLSLSLNCAENESR